MALGVRTSSSLDDLASHLGQWDGLAKAAGRPMAAPALVAAWWAHMRPEGAALHVLTVWQGSELVGILPLVRVGRRYSCPGGYLITVEPLARPGLEGEAGRAFAEGMAGLRPRPSSVHLELQDDSIDWASALTLEWPGRKLWDRQTEAVSVPRIELGDDGFEGWMRSRSRHFRENIRRQRRRLEAAGASLRLSSEATLGEDVAELLRLHILRQNGKSAFAVSGAAQMLESIGGELLGEGRFRLVCVDVEGRMIAGSLLIAAGETVSGWVSGFDEEYGKFSPTLVGDGYALEDMSSRGERTMSLGPGGQQYKYRMATAEGQLVKHSLVPLNLRNVGLRSAEGICALPRLLKGRVRRERAAHGQPVGDDEAAPAPSSQ